MREISDPKQIKEIHVNPIVKTFQYGQHTVTLETGVMARQATGAVMASMDDTSVFVSVVGKKEAVAGRDFFPLTVNYQERAYAAGRIPGGFFKREGRPSEAETLIARGEMRGFLAYADGKCVGWCNANALPALPRLAQNPDLAEFGAETGIIICFVIHPDFRGKGAARQLIRAAVEEFRREGFQKVLGLPFEWKERPDLQYHGTRAMFAEAGFRVLKTDERGAWMVLDLLAQ